MMTSNANPMRLIMVLLVLLTVAFLSGCSSDDQTSEATDDQNTAETTTTLTAEQQAMVKQAAAMANAIDAAPETLAKVLADNQMTSKEFQAMIYDISADPVLSQAYKLERE